MTISSKPMPGVGPRTSDEGRPIGVVAGGPLVPAASSRRALSRKRDQRLRRIVRQARRLAPHLDNPVFTPVLQTFGRVSLLLQDSYERLRDGELIGEDGELRPSIDTVRKLAETQARLAKELGFTPLTLRALAREKTVDLAATFAEVSDGEPD
jgi:hypothetical protein